MIATTRAPITSAPSSRIGTIEAVRGIAAMYVLFHHVIPLSLPGATWPSKVLVFGQAAVIAFFVVSGFVIEHATLGQRPDMSFREYVARRFVRLYPLFVFSLVLAWAAHSVAVGALAPLEPANLLGNLLQMQDYGKPGNQVLPYYGNGPLWSLSYEWWFYMLYFAVMRMVPDHRVQRVMVVVISVLGLCAMHVAPNQAALVASYFPLWWAGVELAREYRRTGQMTFGGQRFTLLMLALVIGGWLSLWAIEGGSLSGYRHPGFELRHAVSALVLVIGALAWIRIGRPAAKLLRGFEHFAPFSYAVYVVHMPIVLFAVAETHTAGWIQIAWVTVAVVALAYVLEGPIQRRINRALLPRLIGNARPPHHR